MLPAWAAAPKSVALLRDEAQRRATISLAAVKPAHKGEDLLEGACECMPIPHNAYIRVDMVGWYSEGSAGNRFSSGFRQIGAVKEQPVHDSRGEGAEWTILPSAQADASNGDGDAFTFRDYAGDDIGEPPSGAAPRVGKESQCPISLPGSEAPSHGSAHRGGPP